MALRHSTLNQQGSDLKYEGYGDLLLRNLNSLKEEETLCDLTLTAENKTIQVHKIVMAACSDYFKALFTLDMKEKNENSIHLKGKPLLVCPSVFSHTVSLQKW